MLYGTNAALKQRTHADIGVLDNACCKIILSFHGKGWRWVPLPVSDLSLYMNSLESADFDSYIKLLVSWGLVEQFATMATLQWRYGSLLQAAYSAIPQPIVPCHGMLPNSAPLLCFSRGTCPSLFLLIIFSFQSYFFFALLGPQILWTFTFPNSPSCYVAEKQNNSEIQGAGPGVRLPEFEVCFCLLRYDLALSELLFPQLQSEGNGSACLVWLAWVYKKRIIHV